MTSTKIKCWIGNPRRIEIVEVRDSNRLCQFCDQMAIRDERLDFVYANGAAAEWYSVCRECAWEDAR